MLVVESIALFAAGIVMTIFGWWGLKFPRNGRHLLISVVFLVVGFCTGVLGVVIFPD